MHGSSAGRLRCAGHVLTEGNSLLNDKELEMIVVLRMNRKFMEFMRKEYPELTKSLVEQRFGRTARARSSSRTTNRWLRQGAAQVQRRGAARQRRCSLTD